MCMVCTLSSCKFNKSVVCPHVCVRFSLYRLKASGPPIGWGSYGWALNVGLLQTLWALPEPTASSGPQPKEITASETKLEKHYVLWFTENLTWVYILFSVFLFSFYFDIIIDTQEVAKIVLRGLCILHPASPKGIANQSWLDDCLWNCALGRSSKNLSKNLREYEKNHAQTCVSTCTHRDR